MAGSRRPSSAIDQYRPEEPSRNSTRNSSRYQGGSKTDRNPPSRGRGRSPAYGRGQDLDTDLFPPSRDLFDDPKPSHKGSKARSRSRGRVRSPSQSRERHRQTKRRSPSPSERDSRDLFYRPNKRDPTPDRTSKSHRRRDSSVSTSKRKRSPSATRTAAGKGNRRPSPSSERSFSRSQKDDPSRSTDRAYSPKVGRTVAKRQRSRDSYVPSVRQPRSRSPASPAPRPPVSSTTKTRHRSRSPEPYPSSNRADESRHASPPGRHRRRDSLSEDEGRRTHKARDKHRDWESSEPKSKRQRDRDKFKHREHHARKESRRSPSPRRRSRRDRSSSLAGVSSTRREVSPRPSTRRRDVERSRSPSPNSSYYSTSKLSRRTHDRSRSRHRDRPARSRSPHHRDRKSRKERHDRSPTPRRERDPHRHRSPRSRRKSDDHPPRAEDDGDMDPRYMRGGRSSRPNVNTNYGHSPHYPPNQISPHSQSPPYSNRGGWGGSQYGSHPGTPMPQGYSPQGQSPYQQQYPPQGQPQNQYFQQRPPYGSASPPNSQYQQNHRGGRGGFRGSHFNSGAHSPQGAGANNNTQPFGGAQAPRGRGGAVTGHFSNLSWTPATGSRGGRAPIDKDRSIFVPQAAGAQAEANSTQNQASGPDPDDDDNPFRPSKDLRVEDEGAKDEVKKDKTEADPATPKASQNAPSVTQTQTQTQSAGPKISFALKSKPAQPVSEKPKPDLTQRVKAMQPPLMRTSNSMRFNQGQPQPRPESRLDSRLPPPDRKSNFRSDHRSDHRHDHRPDRRDRHDSRGGYRSENRGDYRESRDSRRDGRDHRGVRDQRDGREPRDREPRDGRHPRDRRSDLRFEKRQQKPPSKAGVKFVKRAKPRPVVDPEFQNSPSIYYRKPGNESVVGSGTYGKVFKGVHVYTKNMVALKRIRVENEKDGFPVTAIREVKLLEHLKHNNIVQLLEVMVEDNHCYMVFEYLSHDLTGLLNHPSYKLQEAQKKDMAKQLFEGLDYLHHRGVLHRDIKAANILVSNTGELKLADFGLARFYSKTRRLDYTNRVITIWYRSPELLFGETQYGPAVDIWSAACVLVEIFTNYAIFPGDGSELNQLQKIYDVLGTPTLEQWPGMRDTAWYELLIHACKHRESAFEAKYRDKVTPAAYDLLVSMFDYDPANRPTASDVLEHPYFTVEQPAPARAVELAAIQGDWHEFESKALRKEREHKKKEKDRQDRERERQRQKELKRRAEEVEPASDGKGAEHERKRYRSDHEKEGGEASPRGDARNGDAMAVDPL